MEQPGGQAAEKGGAGGIPGLCKGGHDDQDGISPLAGIRLAGGDAGVDQWGEGEVRVFGWWKSGMEGSVAGVGGTMGCECGDEVENSEMYSI